jgi:hypothetical protein
MNAWVEGAPFIRNGLLKVPPVVTLVWPDKGHGVIQDQGQVAAGQGVYCHTAVLDARSNHFTELVPLKTIWHALGRAAKAGTTEYLFVNTGNLRPALMATRAVMELAWKATPWVADQPDESTAYLRKWWREEIGAKAAEHREREPHLRFTPCEPEETDRLEE